MSALDDDIVGTELVTDLREIAEFRADLFNRYKDRLPLQDAERDAGLAEADIWRGIEDRPR